METTKLSTSTRDLHFTAVRDTHSELNSALVQEQTPQSQDELEEIVKYATQNGRQISICGKRNAMGGQQFCNGQILVDMSNLSSILEFDEKRGLITVEPGLTWTGLYQELRTRNAAWTFKQKQTGADCLSLGGALAVNMHGRGLSYQPFIQDIESFVLLNSTGKHFCSRTSNKDLFSLTIGGYGLFGIVSQITIQLVKREVLERRVRIIDSNDLEAQFKLMIKEDYTYGDFQFSCDEESKDFLRKGVFSCYGKPINAETMPSATHELSPEQWRELLYLAHTNKSKAFKDYSSYYEETDGQSYWSDTMQMSTYLPGYHREIDRRCGKTCKGSEMITELNVPRKHLSAFLKKVRKKARLSQMNIIYGTVRLIEKDLESFLKWAKDDYACVIFNLHVDHDASGRKKLAQHCRELIDIALRYNGTFYLTYHRLALKRQILQAYPEFIEFLRTKRKHDPSGIFQSDWSRHYFAMFREELHGGSRE